MYRDGRQERLRMPQRRIGRMSCLTQTLIACGCLLQNEPGKGCRHRAHTPTYTFLYTWSPALVCRGVRSDPLIGATSIRTLSPNAGCGEERVIFGRQSGEGPLWGPNGPVSAFWPSSTNRLVSFSSNNVFAIMYYLRVSAYLSQAP